MIKTIPIVSVTYLIPWAASAAPLQLSESLVIREAQGSSANTNSIAARAHQAEQALSQYQEQFQPSFDTQLRYFDTERAAFAPFAPVFGPQAMSSIGVSKRFENGVAASVSTFTDQFSTTNDSIVRATTTGFKATVSVDLWKNFLGSLSKKQLAAIATESRASELQAAIDKKGFELAARKLYWTLVANNESLSATKTLLESAKFQLKETERRQRASVATAAEVARYRSQVAIREATLTGLEYQREKIYMQFKELLPGLHGKVLTLQPIDINGAVKEVLTCTYTLQNYKDVPWDNTRIDELLSLVDEAHDYRRAATGQHSAATVSLGTEFEYTGVEGSYQDANDQLTEEGAFGYGVSLNISVPLGDTRAKSERLQLAAELSAYESRRQSLMARIRSKHDQMGPLIGMLQASVRSRSHSAKMLAQTIKETKKMYQQARVSVDALVNDQNAVQANLLEQIQTQLAVVHELLDYFQVFTETPCSFNKQS